MGGELAAENQRISDNIREHGWHCLHIFPTEPGQDCFSYSIGFSESYGAPEILIFGLSRDKAHALLNECAQLLKSGHTLEPNVENPDVLAGGYCVVFRPVRGECFPDYLGTALRYYKDKPFAAAVMFLPDREHRFPWHPEYSDIPSAEPLAIV